MILVLLFVAILNGCLIFMDTMLMDGIVPLALNAENHMATLTGTNILGGLTSVLLGFGTSLIVLKFVKKGFDTYILWNGSDAEEEPWYLVVNFVKAMVVAIGFPTLYDWTATIVNDLTNEIIFAINAATSYDWALWIGAISSLGLVTVLFGLVFVICFFLLYFQFIMRGLEMLILRIGIPIACAGLLDNDGGVFKNYFATFLKSMVTIVVQISLAKLGIGLMLNMQVIWGVACMLLSLRTPKFIGEFVIPTGSGSGGGGVINGVYHSARLLKMAKSLVK